MAMLETPSRIWRRIEAVEGRSRDMPSLPSLPAFEDSNAASSSTSESDQLPSDDDISLPIQSTPAVSAHPSAATLRAGSQSASRFASSIASRSSRSTNTAKFALSASRSRALSSASGRNNKQDSFDVSEIPSLPDRAEESDESKDSSLPEVYLPLEEDEEPDVSLTDALQSVSRTGSPLPENEPTPKKKYDYSVSLRSEPQPSPFDKYRNVALRRPHGLARPQTRTPSLSRTTPSPASSSANSTPHSTRSIPLPAQSPIPAVSIPLPRSATASPAVYPDQASDYDDNVPRGEDAYPPLDESQDLEDHFTMDPTHEPQHSEANQSSEIMPRHSDSLSAPSERDPTFSSEEAPTPRPYAEELSNTRSPNTRSPAAFSSPAPSATFTPTPAFPPRPRARFTPRFQTSPDSEDGQENDGEKQVTPNTRRRSFLLSVINSTARPRPKFATPHPHGRTPGTVARPGSALRTAFAGATPRMAPAFGGGSEGEGSSEEASGPAQAPSATPASQTLARWSPSPSPYDSDRASFISTASSHDLTTHARANASFDPVMMGMGGHGVGRFNARKLNEYLHGLNRQLQQENEALVERLKMAEEKGRLEPGEPVQEEGGSRRLSLEGRGRRVSAGGSALGNVAEDVSGEGWMEEKRELEKMVEDLQEDVDRFSQEKLAAEKALAQLEKQLEEEKEERSRDKDRWKDRMGEVEKGVEGIVRELERKVREAEKKAKDVETETQERTKAVERQMEEVAAERDVAIGRAEKAERVLESGKELGGELREVNDRLGRVMGDLRNANSQIQELEDEVMRSDGRIDELEKALKEEKAETAALEEGLHQKSEELTAAQRQVDDVEGQLKRTREELQTTKDYVQELEEGAGGALERIEGLEDQLASAQERVEQLEAEEDRMHDQLEALNGEKERAAELARQMEEALEAAEQKMLTDEEELANLKGRNVSLERDLQREREKSVSLRQEDPSSRHFPPDVDADVEALETELDEANKEIARLSTLLNQSPARKSIERAKDTKIEMLEREKDELAERVRALRLMMGEGGNTPNRVANTSGISPIHRQVLSMHLRTPKTPGAPLRDMSWLNNTMADPTVSPLIAEISRLQRELDLANESIDDKLDKLEDAGLGVVGLTQKLGDARSRIVALEDEIARLQRREDRRVRRLEKVRCQKCHTKVDLRGLNRAAEGDESCVEIAQSSLPTNPPTPPTKTSEALRANLQSVNAQLDNMKRQWEEEKRQLLGEKAVLQDAADKLNHQVRVAKDEVKKTERAGEKARVGLQGELDKAKRAIADLESDLTAERARLRALGTEQHRVHRDKEDIVLQMQRTESDMDDVRRQLQRYKQENHELENELRMNANAEQKVRLLESRVAENLESIEQLRQERSVLIADHKELQQRFSDVSELANRLRDEHAASQTSHDNRRHQLDLQLLEIEDLRRSLASRDSELRGVKSNEHRATSEKNDIARTVAALEADLKRVRKDAEAFGRDLKLLRAEKEKAESKQKEDLAKAERGKKQAQAQIRLLNEQLDGQREHLRKAEDELQGHICIADEQQLSAIKLQHNKECKGLIVQIRYLKAKFTRESSLRCDLGYQKHYLLVLLSRYEKSEQRILASIAQIGFPAPPPAPPKKRRTLKSAALCVVFLVRAQ
ncbi:hypothetical protein PLICRDRAFT_114966 [Plicaturopsis crispa FD-325 SS-3]|nr:hypothetical protein PLICRDRAFT_114966 [Plicaturopsis crispa FD-325 SS-3]